MKTTTYGTLALLLAGLLSLPSATATTCVENGTVIDRVQACVQVVEDEGNEQTDNLQDILHFAFGLPDAVVAYADTLRQYAEQTAGDARQDGEALVAWIRVSGEAAVQQGIDFGQCTTIGPTGCSNPPPALPSDPPQPGQPSNPPLPDF